VLSGTLVAGSLPGGCTIGAQASRSATITHCADACRCNEPYGVVANLHHRRRFAQCPECFGDGHHQFAGITTRQQPD
jgi:hypothetical protein